MKCKKILAALLAISMTFGFFNIPVPKFLDEQPVSAEDIDDLSKATLSDQKANLSFQFIGTSSAFGVSAIPDLTPKSIGDIQVGEYVWVAVQMSEMSRISSYLKTTADNDNSENGGLGSLVLSMSYDKRYLEPQTTKGTLFPVTKLKKAYYPWTTVDIENEDGDMVPTAAYRYQLQQAKADSYSSNSVEKLYIDPDNTMDFVETITLNADTAAEAAFTSTSPRMFQNAANTPDPAYVALFAFKVIDKPTSGAKALQAALGFARFTLGVGEDAASPSAKWVKDQSPEVTDNLKDYFNIVDADGNPTNGVIDIFPTTYSVEFYNSYDATNTTYGTKLDASYDITPIPENSSIKDAGGSIPANDKFTSPYSDKTFIDGYKYVDPLNGETAITADTPITSSMLGNGETTLKIYPNWVAGHTVTFDSNYPSGVTTPTATTKPVTVSPAAGTTFDTSDEPTVGSSGSEDFAIPTGYSFKEWNTQPDGNGTTIVFGTGGTDISAVNTVYAIWSQDWKIEFQKVEGSVESGNVLDTEYMSPTATDKTVLAPSDPSRTGYKFNGWYYYDGSTKTTFVPKGESGATVISGDITIYADWIKQVTVKYYDTKANAQANGATGLLASETVDENTLYSALTQKPTTTDDDATHTKQYFEGWYNVTGDTKVDFSSATGKVTDDLTVYQNWENFYKLEFYKEASDIGGTAYATEYVNPNEATTLSALPTNPTKTGYGFNEWRVYTGGAVTSTKFDTTTTVSGDMTLVADWTQQITITLYPNDGTESDGLGTKVEKAILPNTSLGSDYTAPARTHYTLKEWNTKANGEGTSYPAALGSQSFSASTTLYAIWEVASDVSDSDKVTLTFDSVGGSSVSPITVYKGDTIYAAQMPSNPTKTSATSNPYTFLGWYEAATLSNTNQITAPITMSADKTAYAHWDYTAADAITITFNDNGATTAVNPTSIKIAPNESIGAAWPTDPAKTDNTFGGWYTDTSDELTKKTSSSTFADSTTLNAKWIADITVNYDTNGGNADGPGTVKKPAGDAYVDPTTTPTKNGVGSHPGYTFLGWNTEKNGSGTYIKAGNKPDTSDPLKYSDLVTGGATSVTLYAQWGAYDPENGADMNQEAVTVTFDGNGTTQKPVTKEANPKNKYPQLGDSIGTDNMPNNPERTDYTFAGWNTKADGTGTTVTGTTVFDASLDGVTAVGDGTYTSTVYAQWTPTDPSSAVTVKFNKNTDGTGKSADDVVTLSIVSGDSLGAAMPADPTNGTYAFEGWYAGSVTDGKVTTSGSKLTSSTAISAHTTYYAKWTKMLVARMQKNTAEYTGSQIKPLFDIYEISYPDTQQPYVLGTKIATGIDPTTNSDYTITYLKDSSSATEVKDVASYEFNVQLENTSDLAIAGATIAITDYEENNSRTSIFTVTPKLLTVKVDPDTQLQKAGATVPLADVTIDGLASTDAEANVIEKKYYKWTPADSSDTTIEQSELAEEATPTAIAKYVLQVTVKSTNKNYKIDSVVSSKDGTPVLLYEKTATSTYPAFNILSSDNNIVPGTNIVYVIQANDPSASISVKPGKNDTGLGSALSLYDTDYTTSVTFDDAEHPTRSDYYTRVDKDTDYVEFTITPKNDTTILTAPTAGTGVTITGPDQITGAYTVKVDLTKSGATPNDITITTKAGTDTNAPTLDYNFHIQKLVEVEIKLNPGNSPYGLIQKDDVKFPSQSAKDTAKNSFANSDPTYGNLRYATVPTNGINTTYSTAAWGTGTNYDLVDEAIFIYQEHDFKDPGFVIKDQTGNEVTNATVDTTLTLKSMKNSGLPQYFIEGSTQEKAFVEDLSINGTSVTSGHVYTGLSYKMIRPDVYTMKYTYTYTDAITGQPATKSIERPVIVVSEIGDIEMTSPHGINYNDYSFFKNNWGAIEGYNTRGGLLFTYRIADAELTSPPGINYNDTTELKNHWGDASYWTQFYPMLPEN